MLIGIVVTASASLGASWDSFKTATFSGIDLDKALAPNVLDYTLTLGSAPTVTIGTKTYNVEWVQAFYVVSGTDTGSFKATDGKGPKNWTWDSKTNPGQIAGWTGQGKDRLYASQSVSFAFGSFDPGSNAVAPAYHISYQDGKNSITDWFKSGRKGPVPAVPEPGSILCLSVALGGLFFVARQRERARG